jgi:putative ABC transport system substrate-binding protein
MQIVEHESLDSIRQGFVDALKDLGYEWGKNVEFEFQIAGGDLSN